MRTNSIIVIAVVLVAFLCGTAYADSPKLQYPGNGHWYQRIDTPLTWHEAKSYCESLGGHLATITSPGENEFVFDNFAYPNWCPWLGGTDEDNEGEWRWVTGEPWDYTNWRSGEPNNCCPPEFCGGSGCTPEHYLTFFDTNANFWNDVPNDSNSFVCEWDVEVEIDIKPGSDPNSINLGSNGLIPVAILSSQNFDATNVDPDTIMLAGAGVELRGKGSRLMAHEEDVNGDGLVDLVVQVGTANLDSGTFQDGYAILTGQTFDGVFFEGQDEINIVPPE